MSPGPSIHTADLLATFTDHIRRNAFFLKGQTILVGVSGHSDSVALVRLLAPLAPDLEIALSLGHVQRDDSSEARDTAAFVRHLGSTLALPVDIVSAATATSPTRPEPFWRMPLLTLAEHHGAAVIATGETREDAVEHLLSGLISPSPQRDDVLSSREGLFVRPLLAFSHEACVAYLLQRGFSFRTHPHTLLLDTIPAKIRLLVLPLLERHIHPDALAQCAASGELLAKERDFLSSLVSAARQELRWKQEETRIVFDRTRWLQLPSALRVRLLLEAEKALVPNISLARTELLQLHAEILSMPDGEHRSVGRLKVSRTGGILTLQQAPFSAPP